MSDPTHKAVAVIERGELASTTPHPLVMLQQAVESRLDPDTISKLMDLADRYDATEAKKAYTSALVGLKRDLPVVIAHDQTVDFPSNGGRVHYTHTSLASAIDAVTEPLTQHGFSLSWTPRTEGETVSVTCRLTHARGHSEEATISAPIDRSGSKSPARGIASTITMLQRYTALSMLGIATADMREPAQTDPESVDTDRNMRALRACKDMGHDPAAITEMLGGPVSAWTVGDLDKLREWMVDDLVEKMGLARSKSELEIVGKALRSMQLCGEPRERASHAYRDAVARVTSAGREPGEDG